MKLREPASTRSVIAGAQELDADVLAIRENALPVFIFRASQSPLFGRFSN